MTRLESYLAFPASSRYLNKHCWEEEPTANTLEGVAPNPMPRTLPYLPSLSTFVMISLDRFEEIRQLSVTLAPGVDLGMQDMYKKSDSINKYLGEILKL